MEGNRKRAAVEKKKEKESKDGGGETRPSASWSREIAYKKTEGGEGNQ